MFVDQVAIHIKAGDGGDGCASFRREKYVPRGGPDGGDGGNGGNIVIQASSELHTLLDQKYPQRYEASRGGHGQGKRKHGKNGENRIIRVPRGTLVYQLEPRELLGDLTGEGEILVAARGGRGGRGNTHFATPVRQAPNFAEEGKPGEERLLLLELKLMADVGIIGYPNAGKSTLLSTVSAARPKIAGYPFTTLEPYLGVVPWAPYKSFVMADIPGLIEGAHAGKGLGHQFLRHIERTALLVHLVDVSAGTMGDPVKDLETVNRELAGYNPDLAKKPQVVVPSKIDALEDRKGVQSLTRHCRGKGIPVFPISSATGKGVAALTRYLGKRLEGMREAEPGGEQEERDEGDS